MSLHPLPLIQSPLAEKPGDGDPSNDNGEPELATGDATLYENPQFQHYEETSNIQLFFDLFFVANLTSFTGKHEINDQTSLRSYMGFFSVLWFTWLQVTMYDVRFSTDSVFERIAHACHFGVMIGLAVVGPQFSGFDTSGWTPLQTLSLILMANRFVLMIQYSATLSFVWKYPKSRVPLIIIILSFFITALVYLGISFAYSATHEQNAFIAWYFCAVFESSVSIILSYFWDVVSFTGTHITERLSCLTLIILGEGVIGLTRSIVKIIGYDYDFSSTAIGTIISAVLILYFLYMLYFDNVPSDINDITRHQLWTIVHFPLHIALVLLMEGVSQVLSWRHIIEYINSVFAPLAAIEQDPKAYTDEVIYNTWNNTIISVVNTYPTTADTYSEIQKALAELSPNSGNTTSEKNSAAGSIQAKLFGIVFEGYEISAPTEEATGNVQSFLTAYGNIFNLTFGYFFISAGIVVIILAILSLLAILSMPNHADRRRLLFAALFELALGIGLALLSTMVLTDAAVTLGASGWTLAVLAFVLFAALVVNYASRGAVIVGGPGRTVSRGFGHMRTGEYGRGHKRPMRVGTGF